MNRLSFSPRKIYFKLQSALTRCDICSGSTLGSSRVCLTCLKNLPTLNGPLCRCSLPCHPDDVGLLCGRCIKSPPNFTSSHCAWQYGFPLNKLINRYKHQGDIRYEPILVELWLKQLTLPSPLPDALVPIPLHWWRYFRRGFNQSARLGYFLSQHADIPLLHALRQPKPSALLQGQSASARRKHAHGRFVAKGDLSGKHLVVIDDVMTTTSTANDAARALLKAGAKRVDIWALCRVLPKNTSTS